MENERATTSGEPRPVAPESVQSRKPRVLIVEDDPSVQLLLEVTLQDVTEHVGSYQRADDVVHMLTERPEDAPSIDWVITDWGLKDGENAGSRVVEAVHARYPNCEITIFTGAPGKVTYTPDERQAKRVGVVGKPFNPLGFLQKAQQLSRAINAPKPPR